MKMSKIKDYFSGGHLVECFAILPSINYSWMMTNKGKVWEFQFAWLFWYFTIGNVKVYLDQYK